MVPGSLAVSARPAVVEEAAVTSELALCKGGICENGSVGGQELVLGGMRLAKAQNTSP